MNSEPCGRCGLEVFYMERVRVPVEGQSDEHSSALVHRACFVCAACGRPLSLAAYASHRQGEAVMFFCPFHASDTLRDEDPEAVLLSSRATEEPVQQENIQPNGPAAEKEVALRVAKGWSARRGLRLPFTCVRGPQMVDDDGDSAALGGSAAVDLNTATADALAELPGVSSKLAKAIVDERRMRGLFASFDDLLRVRGIRRSTVRRMRGRAVTVYSEAGLAPADTATHAPRR